MGIPEIELYNILRKKFGNSETEGLIEFVRAEVKSELDTKAEVLLTKTDKMELIDRMYKIKNETLVWIVGVGILQFILSILSKKFL